MQQSASRTMFADELKGNASKKRQELAKLRRQKLKEEERRKKEQEKQKNKQENENTETTNTKSASPGIDIGNLKKEAVSSSSLSSNKSSSAVEIALQQRKLRNDAKLLHRSATVLQTFRRSYRSTQRLVHEQTDILEKRLKDLQTLSKIISQKTQKKYCPPPALTNTMLNQLLYITHTTARYQSVPSIMSDQHVSEKRYYSKISPMITNRHVNLLVILIQYAILPGLHSQNNHLDPAIVWMESKQGQHKFLKLIRLVLCLIAVKKSSGTFLATEPQAAVLLEFIGDIVGIGEECVSENVVQFCKQYLFKQEVRQKPIVLGRRPLSLGFFDLIQLLRSLLLFPSGQKVNVIPPSADRERRNCIPQHERLRSSAFFALLMKIVKHENDLSLKSRIVKEIFTVPILTWKLEKKLIDNLLGSEQKGKMPLFLEYISAFLDCHSHEIHSLSSILTMDDVTLTICPSQAVLSMCANFVQLGVSCPVLNGSKKSLFEYKAATFYFNFMSVVVDAVPRAAFSSRDSEMGWLKKGSVLSPIVLSNVVRDQCKVFTSESFVREIFRIACNKEVLGTDNILKKKDSKDIKMEEELASINTQSATALAAKEASIDRTTNFWQKSKWAKNLKNIFTGKEKRKDTNKSGKGALMNTSSLSRELASGQHDNVPNLDDRLKKTQKQDIESQVKLFYALTRAYSIVISRWGGGGREVINLFTSSSTAKLQKIISESADPIVIPLLNVLSFSTPFLPSSWGIIQSRSNVIKDLHGLTDTKQCSIPVGSRQLAVNRKNGRISFEDEIGSAVLLLMLASLSHSLIVTDDIELHEMQTPLPIHHLRRCILLLKGLIYRACCLELSQGKEPTHFGLALFGYSSKIMRDLYDRSSRRALCAPKHWIINDLLEDQIRRCKSYDDYTALLKEPVLRVSPYLVSFKRRLKLFERITTTNREDIQGRNDGHSFRPGIHVHIMRGRVLEDGLNHLNKLGSNLRRRLIVQYVNAAGATEAGLDAGGLFKEFWTDLSTQSFDPNWALFAETQDGLLYPNPSSRAAHGGDSIVLFEFLGRILGKAIYENITIQPQFAHFFLSFLRGDYNFLHMLPDLSTMDRTLYNNLMFLKTYEGDAEDLCLTFSVTKEEFGKKTPIPLIPNGLEKDVTDLNKHRYIGLVAKHYVCDSVKEQSEAFRRGLWDVIDKNWLQIFNEPELQVVISGPTNGKIDVDDMKANTRLTGGYTILDPNIRRFWKVLSSFTDQQRADLLRFVTSCERPPPLGFGSMNPPFTIQRVSISSDSDKLPTASTCFNILKLPTYSSEKVLKDRLLYAVKSGTGFELT